MAEITEDMILNVLKSVFSRVKIVDPIEQQRAEAHEEIANDVLGWLHERGLYDPRDYEHEGPNVADILTEHEEELLKPRDPRSAEQLLCDLVEQNETSRLIAENGEVLRRNGELLAKAQGALDQALENAPSGLADAHSKSPSRPAMPKEEDTHG